MTTIKLKNGSGAPLAGDLVVGEPALDLTNKRLYTEDSGGTVIEVGVNPTSVTTGNITATGTATFAGLTTTADVSFGDNDKAIFGAGSDLQIYHDGSHSYIVDAGTGNMYVSTNGNGIVMQASLSETMFAALPNGAVTLYHDNAAKLATTATGIDVTGSVTADSATIDGAVTVNGAGINLDDAYSLTWGDGSAQVRGSGSSEAIDLRTASTTRLNIDADGDLSLYNSAGTSQDLFWDSSESRLGLGTTSPDAAIEVYGDVGTNLQTNRTAVFRHPNTNQGILEIRNGRGDASVVNRHSSIQAWSNEFTNPVDLLLNPEGGNVGIGTTSPSSRVHASGDAYTAFIADGTSGGAFKFYKNGSQHAQIFSDGSGDLVFRNNTDSERMRIDSSGNLLVGTTTSNGTNADGFNLYEGSGASRLYIGHAVGVANGTQYAVFNYNTAKIGDITQSGTTAVLYNTTSDQRLKDNIVDAPSASDDIDAIQVRSFDWKADGSHQKYGMVAQELQSVAPEAVSAPEDPEDMMGVDYSKLVPMLVKEIQSLRARVAQLEGAN